MHKKTIKIFVNSFAVSLFTIWTAGKLFAVPANNPEREIIIPEKNIALFFRQETPAAGISTTTPVSSFSLATLSPAPFERELMIDENLFVFDEEEEEEDGVRLSSIEDVADIPLENMAPETPSAPAVPVVRSESEKAPAAEMKLAEQNLPAITTTETTNIAERFDNADDGKSVLAAKDAFLPKGEELATADSLIPLEFGERPTEESIIEIASHAPENQIAMADGGKVDLDAIAVNKEEISESAEPREWYEMKDLNPEAEESPWVVAKGTRNPRNRQVLDEAFYNGLDEEEITAILDTPKTVAEENKEVKVAEMVKNILIPIPEDILNDENLTPQLVSPKKKKHEKQGGQDETSSERKDEEGGILKSLTSIFSSDEVADETDDGETEDDENVGTRKRRGLFSVFSRGKAPSKILPAEMRLSFQPGRAEISGTTLRWIEAFANKVNEDPSVILEIRIDRTSSFTLQQKRLNLLHNILTNKGVEYGKINTVFTNREPNSFIIRTLRVSENNNDNMPENNRERAMYYQSW